MKQAYLKLHIAVLLFGFTAILGALINLNEVHLVWWRVLITAASLALFINLPKRLKLISKRHILYFIGIGGIVALHWMTFFGAIKASNASITLVCLSTASFMTALLEPLIMKAKISWLEPLIGVLIIPGMMLVVSETGDDMNIGIALGLTSALLASIFATLNKKLIEKADSLSITFLEMGGAFLFISLILPFWKIENTPFIPQGIDWIYMLVLALLCTTLAYVFSVQALKHISAFASNLVINLEPVYGIILAWLILKEHKELSINFYFGVLMILLAVFSYPVLKRIFRKKHIIE